MTNIEITLAVVQLLIMSIGVYLTATDRFDLKKRNRKVNSYLVRLIDLVKEIDKLDDEFLRKVGLCDIKKQYFKEITGIYINRKHQKKLVKFKEKTLNDKFSWWDINNIFNKFLFEDNGKFYIKISFSQKIGYFLVWVMLFLAILVYALFVFGIGKPIGLYKGTILFALYFIGLIYFTVLSSSKIIGYNMAKKIAKELKVDYPN